MLVSISDSAKTSNATNTGMTTSNAMGVPNFLGLESTLGKIMPSAYDPSKLVTTNTADSTAGTGGVNRSEAISLTIAAVVTQVLPNGNMVIQGTQEVKTNDEVRQLTVAGIVRPEDISLVQHGALQPDRRGADQLRRPWRHLGGAENAGRHQPAAALLAVLTFGVGGRYARLPIAI